MIFNKQLSILTIVLLVICGLTAATPSQLHGQGYIFAVHQNNPDLIMHSSNYNGTGGVLNVTVGIDYSSVFAHQMEVSVQNVISNWNGLATTINNVNFGTISNSQIDSESVLLHELGHSLGLAHVNLSSELGLSGADRNYSKTSKGANGVYILNAGADGVIGSAVDIRGDDVNRNFFEIAVNNPFTVNAVVDSTTYTNDIAFLPGGVSFVANADRNVSAL